MQKHLFRYEKPFTFECGVTLPYLEIAYHTAGVYRSEANNAVWVCHALTGNSDAFGWWSGLFGTNGCFDAQDDFIICANVLGSCYGSTQPLQTAPSFMFHNFPMVSIRDMARAHELLRQHLGLERVRTLIGGSLGGQQALEWAVMQPSVFEELILVASNARHSAWGIAFNESQRMAIENDPTWRQPHPQAGEAGMKTARAIAMLSYRSPQAYNKTQTETELNKMDGFRAASYQRYQGEKLAQRFNAFSYYYLSRAMDAHHIGRGRGSVQEALSQVRARTLTIGVDSDWLFPTAEQQFLAENIPNAQYGEISSLLGHDGFLVETKQLTELIRPFRQQATVKVVMARRTG